MTWIELLKSRIYSKRSALKPEHIIRAYCPSTFFELQDIGCPKTRKTGFAKCEFCWNQEISVFIQSTKEEDVL